MNNILEEFLTDPKRIIHELFIIHELRKKSV